MNGTFDKINSWEKQQVFKLDNGWLATVEYSFYGEHISRLEKDDYIWHCSSGLDGKNTGRKQIFPLPDFARPWVTTGKECVSANGLVTVGFTKVYE